MMKGLTLIVVLFLVSVSGFSIAQTHTGSSTSGGINGGGDDDIEIAETHGKRFCKSVLKDINSIKMSLCKEIEDCIKVEELSKFIDELATQKSIDSLSTTEKLGILIHKKCDCEEKDFISKMKSYKNVMDNYLVNSCRGKKKIKNELDKEGQSIYKKIAFLLGEFDMSTSEESNNEF